MRFILRHWYSLGLVVAAVAVAWWVFGTLSTVQVILLLNFVALLLHQFEEYAWPGGLPWFINEVLQPKGGPVDRYPLNQNNAFFINVPLGWSFYLIPVFVPDVVWLGLARTLFGFTQLIGHGIIFNRKLKGLYNPGLVFVALGHVPLGIWYLVQVYSKGIITLWDWVLAVAYLACFAFIGMKTVGYGLLASKESSHPFSPEEMERWDPSGRLARIGNANNSHKKRSEPFNQ